MCPGRQRSWRSISLSCYRHQHLPASLELSRHQFVLLSFPPLLFLLSQCCLCYLLATSAVFVPAFGLLFSRFLLVDFLCLSVVLCHFSWLPRFSLPSLACSSIVSCSSILCPSFFLCHLLVAVVVYNSSLVWLFVVSYSPIPCPSGLSSVTSSLLSWFTSPPPVVAVSCACSSFRHLIGWSSLDSQELN
jgi:hypothetical protein